MENKTEPIESSELKTFHYFNVAIYEDRAEVLHGGRRYRIFVPTFLVYSKEAKKMGERLHRNFY